MSLSLCLSVCVSVSCFCCGLHESNRFSIEHWTDLCFLASQRHPSGPSCCPALSTWKQNQSEKLHQRYIMSCSRMKLLSLHPRLVFSFTVVFISILSETLQRSWMYKRLWTILRFHRSDSSCTEIMPLLSFFFLPWYPLDSTSVLTLCSCVATFRPAEVMFGSAARPLPAVCCSLHNDTYTTVRWIRIYSWNWVWSKMK